MSDTPKTDAAEASALEVGQWHIAKLCRELERENAALKSKIKFLWAMIDQAESDLNKFASVDDLKNQKETQL